MSGPLSIGIVCPYSLSQPGGVQNHVLGLARELRRLGHRPQILAPGELPAAEPDTDELPISGAGQGLPVRYNGSVARVNFGPRSSARVSAWLSGNRFDLLHLHEPVTPSISLLALRASRVPVVATFHTATPGSTAMRVAGRVLGPMINRIDLGIAVSDSAQVVVHDHLGIDPMIIPNGIDCSAFAGSRATAAVPRITLLGRLDEERKGLAVFLSALPRIRSMVGEIDVVIAGPGRHRLPEGVRRTGYLSDAQRSALLRSTDVFVAPNLGRESFGLVVVEALAAGAAVVASDLPAFRDVLTRADGALVGATSPAGDEAGLASAVAAALAQARTGPVSQRVRERRAHARSYDWRTVGPAVVDGYRRAFDLRSSIAGIA
ncbi:glycosyltransferase family 4 protein [Naumannella halotolerans]|uniref:Phosphatidylinositol alpha-mannosyltransferase n=1 Tax=Naumannella halotolerans TaxID=993414 RepID=A0A4R7J8Y8_9ACTN|nr:glycosyltransferase family 4 protein [Naumannella halotolerans]TDT33306.1 phosphatidylinositol alpha-mannosyltransferase [Naumannella halotolerans]